jgi:hypothetical protein
MFKSYEYIRCLGKKADGLEYQYSIIDDNFIETAYIVYNKTDFGKINPLLIGIIEIYERRNLNVAANLALLISYMKTRYGWTYLTPSRIKSEKFSKYEKELSKYLILL